MSQELINALIIAFIVNAMGLVVFLTGQIVLFLIIKPYREFKEQLEKVDYYLIYHSRFYTSPLIVETKKGEISHGDKKEISKYARKIYSSASDDLRHSAVGLLTKAKMVPRFLFGHFKFPTWDNLHKAYFNLIFLSNTTFMGNPLTNHEKAKEINTLLNL